MTPTHVWMREHHEPANLRIAGWHLQGILAAYQVMETLRITSPVCALKRKRLLSAPAPRQAPESSHSQAGLICSYQLDSSAAASGISSSSCCDGTQGRSYYTDKKHTERREGTLEHLLFSGSCCCGES